MSYPWIITFSGKAWNLLEPHYSHVCITDIAHALSGIGRFNGHSREFYSVAQHSIYVASILEEWRPANAKLQLWGLLHDAAEAYIGDMSKPLKSVMPSFQFTERKTMEAVRFALDLPFLDDEEEQTLKEADLAALMAERRDLCPVTGPDWGIRQAPYHKEVIPLPDRLQVRAAFLDAFQRLNLQVSRQ